MRARQEIEALIAAFEERADRLAQAGEKAKPAFGREPTDAMRIRKAKLPQD